MCPVNTTTMEPGSTECGKHTGFVSKRRLMLTQESKYQSIYTIKILMHALPLGPILFILM